MTPLDTKILIAILGDFDSLRAVDPRNIDRRRDTNLVIRVEDARYHRLVPLAVGIWMQDSSGAGLKAGQRAIAHLEADGAVVRLARWSGRATHLELTEAGERLARELAQSETSK